VLASAMSREVLRERGCFRPEVRILFAWVFVAAVLTSLVGTVLSHRNVVETAAEFLAPHLRQRSLAAPWALLRAEEIGRNAWH